MEFNRHPDLEGQHAFLSASNYHWIGYDDVKLEARFASYQSARRGTELHNLAHEAIRLRVKLDARSNKSLAAYVNDAIGYKMDCEQPLVYSNNCFGTADAISFRRNTLRIHDLKTGVTATSERQLEVYAALFCLEYGYSPFDIDIELRIYQADEVRPYFPSPEFITDIMEKIMDFSDKVDVLKASDR